MDTTQDMSETEPAPSRKPIIWGIILLFVWLLGAGLLFYPLKYWHLSKDSWFYLSRLIFWFCLIIMWLYAVKVEKRPLLLWKDEKYHFSFYILSFLAIIGIMFFGTVFLSIIIKLLKLEGDRTVYYRILDIFKTDKLLLVFTCITAGICEELLFRGYLVTRLELLFKKPYVAIIISSVLFGVMHLGYGNVGQAAGPFFIGLVFAAYYQRYRNIKVLIFCHFIWDLVLLLIAVYAKSK